MPNPPDFADAGASRGGFQPVVDVTVREAGFSFHG